MQFKVKVIPQSSRLEVVGLQGDTLRIKLTKGAHDGEANEQLIAFLAKLLHVAKKDLQIIHGEHNREKTLECPLVVDVQQLQTLFSQN